MSNIAVRMSVTGAYSNGADDKLGIPLSVHAISNVKIDSSPLYIGNAIERFLGRGRDEIARVAKETLEGHLRGVLARMTPEEVNEDRLKFAKMLAEEAEADLQKLGLQLDTLNIQHVADDRQYLESIGRARIAQVIRAAEVAESDAQRSAKEAEAASLGRSEVAVRNAQARILEKENELRHIRAELDAEARSEEERAIAAAEAARAEAEKELQGIRVNLEQLRLAADVTIPAEANRRVREFEAAGNSAAIAADGQATAMALAEVAKAWKESDGKAMDMYVLQNLDEIFARVADAAKNLKVREVNLVDAGDGKTLPAYMSAYPATVSALLDQVTDSLGVDIRQVITGKKKGEVAPATEPAALPAPASDPAVTSENVNGGQSW
jgi:flotillin